MDHSNTGELVFDQYSNIFFAGFELVVSQGEDF